MKYINLSDPSFIYAVTRVHHKNTMSFINRNQNKKKDLIWGNELSYWRIDMENLFLARWDSYIDSDCVNCNGGACRIFVNA